MARREPLRLLLDSHVLVWSLSKPEAPREATLSAIADRRNGVHVSAISPWELEIKRATGTSGMPLDLLERIEDAGFIRSPITFEHGVAAGRLPLHHRDPFDRMLVAQAQLEGLTLVTDDAHLTLYDVPILRA